MRRFATLATAVVSAVALAVPTVGATSSSAAPGSGSAQAGGQQLSDSASAFRAKKGKIRVKKASKGVQPGIGKQKVTAFVKGGGKVKFTLKGTGITKNKKIKAKKGKAVYKVPPLGTGQYKVIAKYDGRKGSTKFKVFNSNLTVNSTTFTFSKSASSTTFAPLSGNVFFKDKVATEGFVDLYLNGNIKGGANSPDLIGFAGVQPDGTFNFLTSFGRWCTTGNGQSDTNFANGLAPGTYTFQAYFTDDSGFDDYISSNFITVVVTP